MKISKRGFTLIELMVIISIIGLMSSVVLSAISSARVKARDTQRIRDLQEISKAVELYYDKYGYYPLRTGTGIFGAVSTAGSANWASLETTLKTEGFLSALSRDPTNTGSVMTTGYAYRYQVNAAGTAYDILTRLESDHPIRCGRTPVNANVTFNTFTTAGSSLCPNSGIPATYNYDEFYLRGSTVQ